MKVVITYPPLNTAKGIPLLSQNRQFQYFKRPTYIYPVVPATAATLLKKEGFKVVWKDCIAEGWDLERFYAFIQEEKPDVIAIETKTPVVKEHWEIIDRVSAVGGSASGGKGQRLSPKVVLLGDHVTALPEESFENSKVDFVITGGDYDFLLFNLCSYLRDLQAIGQLTTKLEPGIYYRENGQVKNTGKFQLNHNLDVLPFIDRDLTNWKLYAYENGNYKNTPGTYIMSARDCWWGRCTFCSWPALYPQYRSRTPGNVLEEVSLLVEKYGVQEIMDDSGSLSAGQWLKDFSNGMISRGLNKRVNFDCNMRFGALSAEDYRLMKRAGFRLLLFGLESANQNTLDRINKNLTVQQIIDSCKLARKSGLYPHITVMFGYPWETYEEAVKTLKLGQWLLKKGYAYTMQATVVIPYPGSPLFEECKANEWLKTTDWQRYDMKEPVMKSPINDEKIMSLVQSLYRVALHPEFIFNRLTSISSLGDFAFFFRAFPRVFGHIFDFKAGAKK